MRPPDGLQAERTAMAWQRTALGVGAVGALLVHQAGGLSLETVPGLLALAAALALLLAGIGIHGLLSLAVSQRLSELGLRLAIGAGRRRLLRQLLTEAVVLGTAGAVVGLVLAYAAGRSLAGALAGVEPGDAVTFAIAFAAAVLMTLSGTLVPALRVLRFDAARVLLSS